MLQTPNRERKIVTAPLETRSNRSAWVKRAAISGAVGVVSGFVAHVTMGGAVPGLAGIIPAAVAATLVSLAVLYKPGVVRTVAATLASQWLFHNLAGLGVGSGSTGHVHGAVEPLVAVGGADAAMGLGHLVAAIVTAGFVLGTLRLRHYARVFVAIVSSLVTSRLATCSVSISRGPARVAVSARYGLSDSRRAWSARLLRGPPAALSY